MAKTFEDLRQAALVTDRAAFRMHHRNTENDSPEWFSLTATDYDLSGDFLSNGKYNYTFHTYAWKDGNDIFADILGRSANLSADPSYIGIYNWNGGTLKREGAFAMMRMDMAFAIVIGADPISDADALRAVFLDAITFPVIVVI